MIKFIRYFILGWQKYPHYMFFRSYFSDKDLKQMEELDAKSGIKPYKNRLDFAYRQAKIYYAHRDRYGRKCKKNNGNCEKCNAKHC